MNLDVLKGKKKVSVVGFAPSWNKTDFKDPEMIVAGINGLYTFFDQVPESHYEFWFSGSNHLLSPCQGEKKSLTGAV